MLNLKELSEKYKDVGLGYIRFGGKSYYEVNSDKPLSLNAHDGKIGFVLNENQEVELFDLSERVLIKRHYYKDLHWEDEVDYETEYWWDEKECEKWWGKTLDNYYPHPWYPDKKIIAFELINDIPFFRKGKIFNLFCGEIECNYGVKYSEDDCLKLPEFFKPIYK